MLQYMGTRQPPRAYPVLSRDSTDTENSLLCDSCRDSLWTVALFDKLKADGSSASALRHIYTTSSGHLRQASIEGCRWCQGLADGIHGRAYLDAVYDAWAQSDEQSGEGSDISFSDEIADLEEASADSGPGEEQVPDQCMLGDAEYDPAGIWDPGRDHDTLAIQCEFEVTLSFERNVNGLYTFLNVHIESLSRSEENILHRIQGDRAVDLRYYLHQSENSKSRTHTSAQRTSDEVPSLERTPPSVFPMKPQLSLLRSEANFLRIQSWLKSSISYSNTMVSNAPQSRFAPSRLICVQSKTSLRVVDTSDLSYEKDAYACLSYVWGKDQNFVALEANLDDLKTNINHVQLPKTIQDAVEVTRRLGLAYLWVDAMYDDPPQST